MPEHADKSQNSIPGQMWALLPRSRRYGILRLWFVMILGTILEMLGIGMIVPVITLLTKPELVMESVQFSRFSAYLGDPSQQNLIIGIMLLLVGVYVIKNLYLGMSAWWQSRFIYGMQSELAQKLFATYLRQPYTFHLTHNSAHLLRNIQSEIGLFINGMIIPGMLILAEGLVVCGLFGLLLYVEPIGTVAVFAVLLLAGSLFYLVTREKVASWGRQRQFHEGARIKLVQEALGGIKDVKLSGRETDFLDRYESHTTLSMKMSRRQFVMQQVPRLWLEILAVGGLAVLIVAMTIQQKPLESFIPTLALFAAISFRLMPSASRILSSIQQLRFSVPAVTLLDREFKLPSIDPLQQENVPSNVFDENLELAGISFNYPNTEKPALDGISLKIKRGETIGFIGESGSGKSTLIDLILGLLAPTQGQLLLDGHALRSSLRSWQNQIGYVTQSIYLSDDTLRRNIAFGIADRDIDDAAVARAIRSAQLERFVESLPEGSNTIVGERGVRLSGGQRQRIGIARALYHDPAVLVLDEATSALDTETEAEVMAAVTDLQGKKTILIVAHRLSTVRHCDRLYRLDQGRIVGTETPSEVLQ